MLDSVKNIWLILTTAFSVICIVFIFYGVKPLVEKNLALEMTVESLDVKVNELNKNIKVLSEVRSKLVEDTSNIEARYKNADALILELKSVLKEKRKENPDAEITNDDYRSMVDVTTERMCLDGQIANEQLCHH